jgi:hypothetical protein
MTSAQQQEINQLSSLTDTISTAHPGEEDNNDPGFGMYECNTIMVDMVPLVIWLL